jgi:hypothetical protein
VKGTWKTWSAAVAALLLTLPLGAQQTAKEAELEAGKPADYQKILRPEDKFEILGRFAGSWEGSLKALLHGTPPKEAPLKDTLEAKWLLDDHFIDVQFTTQFGDNSNRGRVTMGYDGAKKHFYRIFLVSLDPRATFSTGQYIRSKNALVFHGIEEDPISGDSFTKRDVFTFIDKDKIYYEQFYAFADGSEVRVMEGYYNRVTGK